MYLLLGDKYITLFFPNGKKKQIPLFFNNLELFLIFLDICQDFFFFVGWIKKIHTVMSRNVSHNFHCDCNFQPCCPLIRQTQHALFLTIYSLPAFSLLFFGQSICKGLTQQVFIRTTHVMIMSIQADGNSRQGRVADL